MALTSPLPTGRAMPTPTPPLRAVPPTGDTYLFASDNGPHISWLSMALQRRGTVVPVSMTSKALDERIAALNPQAVFLDFSVAQSAAATEVHQQLKRDWPELTLLATGSSIEPAAMLAALRAGVADFVDLAGSMTEVHATLDGLMQRRTAELARVRGRSVALLGARAGLGVTTLATNMALLMQEALARQPHAGGGQSPAIASFIPSNSPSRPAVVEPVRGVALLDLGLPARDGLLYLDTPSTFSFVDGVHNLRRLDPTLVQTAIARHASGTAILPLPASLAQVRDISHADSVTLIRRMADFFDYQIADLGGFTSTDFIAQSVQEADKTWVVCDQSIGSIVSTANLLRELQSRGLDPQRFFLVVNKFDSNVGISARDIAGRLGLPLAHTLPMRRTALLSAGGRGEVLARASRNDPYVVAVQGMVRALQREYGAIDTPVPPESPWAQFMAQLTGKWKSARES